MAHYAYKDCVYRKDFQETIPELEKEWGEPYEQDPNYDGDCWVVAARLLDKKDAEIKALHAKLEAMGA